MNQCRQEKAFLFNSMAKNSCKRNKGLRQLLVDTKINRQCLLTMRGVPSPTVESLKVVIFIQQEKNGPN